MSVHAAVAGVLARFYERLDSEARDLESRDPRFRCPSPCSACCVANTFVVTGLEFGHVCLWVLERVDAATRADLIAVARRQVDGWTVEDALRLELGLEEDPERAPKHPCPLLLDGLCRVYPARPSTCRLFGRSRYASGALNVCDLIAAAAGEGPEPERLPVVEERSRVLVSMLVDALPERDLEALDALTGVATIPHFIAETEFDPERVADVCVPLSV